MNRVRMKSLQLMNFLMSETNRLIKDRVTRKFESRLNDASTYLALLLKKAWSYMDRVKNSVK